MVMEGFLLMLSVAACYTISSLSDKYAVSKAGFNGNEFTFIMCGSMSIMLCFTLPFQEILFTLTWQSFAAVLLIALCKILEFQMSALVLKQLSAFELKAWLGITLFASYFTDIFYGEEISILSLICISTTVVGLVLISRSGKRVIDYKKIIIPFILYLLAKYGYGLIIKAFTPYASPTMQLLPALIIVTIVMLFKVNPAQVVKKNKSGLLKVILARIPNTIGMFLENAVIGISLVSYSFIQPMILVSLFFISLIRRENSSKLNLIGSIICVIGVVLFQIFK